MYLQNVQKSSSTKLCFALFYFAMILNVLELDYPDQFKESAVLNPSQVLPCKIIHFFSSLVSHTDIFLTAQNKCQKKKMLSQST